MKKLIMSFLVVVLFCYSFFMSPLYASAETCAEIDYNVTTIAAGAWHTIGLKDDGTVVAAGTNEWGQLNVYDWTNIKAIATSDSAYHTVGLKEDGTVVAAGWNDYGQLNVSNWTNIKAIAAGGYHTVGLKEDGTVVAIGWNNYGQLNVSDWTNITAIAAATWHTVGIKEGGALVAVGANWFGQLNVSDWTNIRQPACVDPASLLNSLQGLIGTLSGISAQSVNSLTSKVENAIVAYNSGNETAAINILNALLNEISAQSGKKITTVAASTLTAYIENIITAIQGG